MVRAFREVSHVRFAWPCCHHLFVGCAIFSLLAACSSPAPNRERASPDLPRLVERDPSDVPEDLESGSSGRTVEVPARGAQERLFLKPEVDEPSMTPEERVAGRNRALTSAVNRLAGIRQAVVVTFGSSALVGIRKEDGDQDRWRDTVQAVEEELLRRDPLLERIHVTTDETKFRELQEIARGIQDGRPVTDYSDRLEKLVDSM